MFMSLLGGVLEGWGVWGWGVFGWLVSLGGGWLEVANRSQSRGQIQSKSQSCSVGKVKGSVKPQRAPYVKALCLR